MDTTVPAGPRIAVAFGGGGARGIAHIHIVDVLDELGIKPVAIAGSSIGSIIGTGMANGMSGRELRDYMGMIFTHRSEIARRIWRTRPERWGELLKGGFRVSQFNIEKVLDVFLPPELPANVEDLKVPMSITASDFHAAKELNIEKGDLRSAIAASCAIPPVFAPVRREGRILVDGGLFNPVPFDLLFDKADIVIGIDVVGAPVGPDDHMPSTFEAVMGGNQLTMCAIIENKFRCCAPHIFLRPNVDRIGLLDFTRFEQILSQSAGVRDELKRALDGIMAGKNLSS
ncbi:patatin-like phospholipase family protein [Falsochrobactrum sp. TDYN1]|uniref:Patatin-like phospholipase family protein n=1 Tax=Falsochrobactrum tianjinense TaxID=2706015 RepID=A0A949PN18_9HYPH|nr:patatin-like phospholipase family protein [Falsochrobactrum sp. TDYN1]MBV2143335.1 patatin-like phospholipase family protein [Falsochrobactrum sp. TDYN1]